MRGMARFRRVETYPPTGSPDRLWGSSPDALGNPVHDAFLRAARSVVELYSSALDGLALDAGRSSLRLAVGERLVDDQVSVEVWRDRRGLPSEPGFVHRTPDVASLAAGGRARLALEVVDTAVRLLGDARGWDPAGLDACRAHVEDSGYAFRWASAWRPSPDRRHRARAIFRLDTSDGFGRARLEVGDRAADEVVLTSGEAVAFCTSAGFTRSARSLAWSGPDEVSFTPYSGLVPAHDGGPLTARATVEGWHAELPEPVVVRTPGEGLVEEAGAAVPTVTGSLT